MFNNKKDYSKTIIYQIVNGTTCFHIDSTNNFTQRKSSHKTKCNNNENNLKIYKFMRENGWTGDFEKGGWDMIPIEKFPCVDAIESNARVFHHLKIMNPMLI